MIFNFLYYFNFFIKISHQLGRSHFIVGINNFPSRIINVENKALVPTMNHKENTSTASHRTNSFATDRSIDRSQQTRFLKHSLSERKDNREEKKEKRNAEPAFSMAMGWWKPYFFLDPTGVQLLLPNLVIDGSKETLFVSGLAIAVLALLDRYTAHAAASRIQSRIGNSNDDDNYNAVYFSALCYTVQKFTSGLLMLIMMSFNAVLFLEVVLFSGAAELWMKLRTQNNTPRGGGGSGTFHRIHTSEVEMNDC
jgi:hypothetical protein